MQTVKDLIEFLKTLPEDTPLVEGNTSAWNHNRIEETDFNEIFYLCEPSDETKWELDETGEYDYKPISKPCLMIYNEHRCDY